MDDDFNLKGLITIKDIEKQIKYPSVCKGLHRAVCSAVLLLVSQQTFWIVYRQLVNAHVDVVVLDSAHGHSANVI